MKSLQKTSKLCSIHPKFPVLANEFCESCSLEVCYMCASEHNLSQCFVDQNLADNTSQLDLLNKENSIEKKLLQFNLGFLAEVNLELLTCNCGTNFLNSETSAICVACGNISCSDKCHKKHYADKDLCYFKYNFPEDYNFHSLNSITLNNIKIAEENQISQGMILNKTSTKFIAGYKHDKQNHLFLQRGYRQYGNPSDSTVDQFKIQETLNMDYNNHFWRVCNCGCFSCGQYNEHPVFQCQQKCEESEIMMKQDLGFSDYANLICECECQFCMSSKIRLAHKNIDCMVKCKEKDVKIFIEQSKQLDD